jgi:hypothetical protein
LTCWATVSFVKGVLLRELVSCTSVSTWFQDMELWHLSRVVPFDCIISKGVIKVLQNHVFKGSLQCKLNCLWDDVSWAVISNLALRRGRSSVVDCHVQWKYWPGLAQCRRVCVMVFGPTQRLKCNMRSLCWQWRPICCRAFLRAHTNAYTLGRWQYHVRLSSWRSYETGSWSGVFL